MVAFSNLVSRYYLVLEVYIYVLTNPFAVYVLYQTPFSHTQHVRCLGPPRKGSILVVFYSRVANLTMPANMKQLCSLSVAHKLYQV